MKNELDYFKDETFYPYLKRLEQIKGSLSKYSLLIVLFLLGSLISMALFAFMHKFNLHKSYSDIYTNMEPLMLIITFTFIIFGIFLLFRFNSLRDKGMILYEEITDEIDWSRKRKEFIHRPPIQLRIIIKEFLKSTDLPFTTGKNGQAFYLLLFILNCIATVLIKILVNQ